MAMVAATWFALVVPIGARAVDQLVTIVDDDGVSTANVTGGGALRVSEVSDPARLPYRQLVSVVLASDLDGRKVTFHEVPANKRLVVDTISVLVRTPSGQRPTILYLSVSGTANYLPVTFMGTSSTTSYFQGMQRVQIYADPGSELAAAWSRSTKGNGATAFFSISGHYVRA
jgi:hypothetical protein